MPLDDSGYPPAHALKKLFQAGEKRAIGFKHQGGENSPFDRFVRYSYQEDSDFRSAFKLGKARLPNEIDVYPAGIIAIRNFNGTEVVLAIGSQITQDDFEKTFALIKERTIDYRTNKTYRYTWPVTNTSSASPVSMDGFYILMNNHPFEGKRSYPPCMTEALERKIYGEQPLFIFDKDDDSNAPVPGINSNAIKRWPLYPPYICDKFQEAFSQHALKDPSKRIIEKEWLKVFVRLRSEIYKCQNCGEIFFADAVNGTPCPSCRKEQLFEKYIALPKFNIALHERTKLYECHTDINSLDFQAVAAKMVVNEKNGEFELKDISANKSRLAQFTGSIESVLEVHNSTWLHKMIKFVSVRASQVASRNVQVSQVMASTPANEAQAASIKQITLNEQLTQAKTIIVNTGND